MLYPIMLFRWSTMFPPLDLNFRAEHIDLTNLGYCQKTAFFQSELSGSSIRGIRLEPSKSADRQLPRWSGKYQQTRQVENFGDQSQSFLGLPSSKGRGWRPEQISIERWGCQSSCKTSNLAMTDNLKVVIMNYMLDNLKVGVFAPL